MDSKTYLDQAGVVQLLKDVSASITNHTSGKIERDEVEDLDTGKVTVGDAKNPNNLATVKAVVDYLKNRREIIVNQQSTDSDYTIKDNQFTYNGEDSVQIDIKLATANDIDNLFASRSTTTPVDDPTDVDDDF